MKSFIVIYLMILTLCFKSCCIQGKFTQPDGTHDGFQYGELLGEGYRCTLLINDTFITLYFVDTEGNSHTIYESNNFLFHQFGIGK